MVIDNLSANSMEGSKKITIGKLYEMMQHKRDLKLAVIFVNAGVEMKKFDMVIDDT